MGMQCVFNFQDRKLLQINVKVLLVQIQNRNHRHQYHQLKYHQRHVPIHASNHRHAQLLINMIQDCEATDLRALQQGEKVKPHKVEEEIIITIIIIIITIIIIIITVIIIITIIQVTCGLFLVNSGVIWEKMEGSSINLTGKSKAKVELVQINININLTANKSAAKAQL